MINYQEQKMQPILFNETEIQQILSNLSCLLNSCQTMGIQPTDFGIMMHDIVDDVIDGANDNSPTRELKRPLLFLRAIGTFLNSLSN